MTINAFGEAPVFEEPLKTYKICMIGLDIQELFGKKPVYKDDLSEITTIEHNDISYYVFKVPEEAARKSLESTDLLITNKPGDYGDVPVIVYGQKISVFSENTEMTNDVVGKDFLETLVNTFRYVNK